MRHGRSDSIGPCVLKLRRKRIDSIHPAAEYINTPDTQAASEILGFHDLPQRSTDTATHLAYGSWLLEQCVAYARE
jgi:hypothetical protein